MISEIGNSIDNRLQCITDRMPCCRSEAVGEWYFPGDGGMVPIIIGSTTFYRSRGDDGTVNLNRVNNDVVMPTGQYCCVVPDATGVMQWACAMISEILHNLIATRAANGISGLGYDVLCFFLILVHTCVFVHRY